MPPPLAGKAMTPLDRRLSSSSLRRNGAAAFVLANARVPACLVDTERPDYRELDRFFEAG